MDNLVLLYAGIGVVAVLIVAIIVWIVAARSGLARRKQSVDAAWAGIAQQLQHRGELVPPLVRTAQEHGVRDDQLFSAIEDARSRSLRASSPGEAAAAEPGITGAVRGVLATASGNPQLRADEEFVRLQQELGETDDNVQAARRTYNSSVRDFNTRRKSFPSSMFAGGAGFEEREFFEVDDPNAKAEAPRVQF